MKTLFALVSFALATATFARAADTTLFRVQVSGHGKPMLLIPGLSCPGEVWDATVRHYAKKDFECHVVSLAGFAGVPATPHTGPLLAQVREALAAYIEKHELHRPVIVGHSLGGFLAMDLAAKHPELPGSLIIVDALPFLAGAMRPGTTLEDARANAAGMRAFFENIDAATYERQIRSGSSTRSMVSSDEDHNRIVAWSLASDRATVVDAMTEMLSTDLRDDLASIRCPALVFGTWIAYKEFTTRERTEEELRRQFAKLRDTKLVMADSARHFIMFDAPDWMLGEMDAFLDSSRAR